MHDTLEKILAKYDSLSTMHAIALTRIPEIGAVAESLEMVKLPIVRPEPEEVAIRLCASSMHIDEVYAAQGTALGRFYGPRHASPSQPHVLGSSVSGIVVATGAKADGFSLGDEVLVVPDHKMESGSWAEYRCVNQNLVVLKPEKFTHVESAAIAMAACVALGAIETSKVEVGDRCVVVGASGSIGMMIVQYLKALECQVTAVCSGKNEKIVLGLGADSVIDYTNQNFAVQATESNELYDAVFDCVGGKDVETDAFRVLEKTGVFQTVVGPLQYIGENKLSRFALVSVITYVLRRMFMTLFVGPRYKFSAKYPQSVLPRALSLATGNNISMPIERVIPFTCNAVSKSVRLLSTHRARGRIVIDFDMPW